MKKFKEDAELQQIKNELDQLNNMLAELRAQKKELLAKQKARKDELRNADVEEELNKIIEDDNYAEYADDPQFAALMANMYNKTTDQKLQGIITDICPGVVGALEDINKTKLIDKLMRQQEKLMAKMSAIEQEIVKINQNNI